MKNRKLDYKKTYGDFLSGRITEVEWRKFCKELLYEKLEENRDVFIRLKER